MNIQMFRCHGCHAYFQQITLFVPVYINNIQLPQDDDVKYLGLHLDWRFNWRKHIFTKRKQLGMTPSKMHGLHGSKSKLSTSNRHLIHKAILKPIWTYRMQLWGMVSTSSIELLQCFQYKAVCMTLWHVVNTVI
jgi:hypothetical protein